MKTDSFASINMTSKLYTLVFIQKDEQVLLGLKKRGFGVDKWNGFGGKVEPNESSLETAIREVKEESSLLVKAHDLKNVGHLQFTFQGNPIIMNVRVYTTNVFEGTPKETDEMMPQWFHTDEIPFKDMWLDDKFWFPYMLNNQLFFGRFHYKGYDKIIWHEITELLSMEAFNKKKKLVS